MKRLVLFMICLITAITISHQARAEDVFPEFKTSLTRLYIPTEAIQIGFQEDLEHEVGFNFSYNANCQLFVEQTEGHIQTLAEGFSGTTDKSTPWKTLTELLAAYYKGDTVMVKSLYTADSQSTINNILSDTDVERRFIAYMEAIQNMNILIGFDHKDGFITMVNVEYSDGTSELVSFFFVLSGSEYLLKSITLDEAITANISLFLQTGHTVAELAAPKHGLSVEKTGTGDGTVRGSGIDCGEDCIEVFVEGTAVWLKADSDEYSTFEGWLVDGQPISDRLVIKEDTTVTAVFEKIPPKEYTLTIEMAGAGTGAVSDSDAACEAEDASCLELFSFYAGAEEAPVQLVGLDCGETCSVTYTEGTTVYLQAAADEGSEFVEWQMNGEAVTEPLEISEDTTITAVFEQTTPPEPEPQQEEPVLSEPEPEPEQTQP